MLDLDSRNCTTKRPVAQVPSAVVSGVEVAAAVAVVVGSWKKRFLSISPNLTTSCDQPEWSKE